MHGHMCSGYGELKIRGDKLKEKIKLIKKGTVTDLCNAVEHGRLGTYYVIVDEPLFGVHRYYTSELQDTTRIMENLLNFVVGTTQNMEIRPAVVFIKHKGVKKVKRYKRFKTKKASR